MTQPATPSLLIQAARNDAIADGLVAVAQQRAAQKANQLKNQIHPNQPKQDGDTFTAALAMVAAGNANKTPAPAVQITTNNNITKAGGMPSAPSPALSSNQSHHSSILSSSTQAPNMLNSTGVIGMSSNIGTEYKSNAGNHPGMRAPMPTAPVNVAAPPALQQQLHHPASSAIKQSYASPPTMSINSMHPTTAGSAAHRLALASTTVQQMPPPLKNTMPAPVSSHMPTTTQSTSRSSSSGSSGGKKKGPPLRRGKWTPEEEAYANRLIMEFKSGLLPLTDGTTLRTFLSKLLNCDPMRISKKFVGNNCIGKQVFRRRTADINRLTPEQIQTSRAELSELERRFLERVAQTNRVKSSGVNNSSNVSSAAAPSAIATAKVKADDIGNGEGLTPPWLHPPVGFKHGTGAALAAANLSSGSNRAALAGRALLQGRNNMSKNPMGAGMNKTGSTGLLALMEMQSRQNRQNVLNQPIGNSGSNLLAAAAGVENKNVSNGSNLSGGTIAQLSRNASAAKMANLLKSGISRDQLSQLVRDHRNSSSSLANMMERQSSLDALMSLDFQSLQSIDNLANLIQTGRGGPEVPRNGLKNWSSDNTSSSNNLSNVAASMGSNGNMSSLADARRRQSEGRMENLIRSLSSNNVANRDHNSGESNANFNNILQSMQNNLGSGHSSNNLLGSASALNLANMFRTDSSTGLTALRMQDGLAQRNTSVDDFLSLVASGDIPHQDPHMLNVPLHSVLQQQQHAAQFLAQQQLLAQAANGNVNNSLGQRLASLGGLSNGNVTGMSNSGSLGDRIASFGGLANHNSAASLLSQFSSQQGNNSAAAAVLAQQQQQQQHHNMNSSVLAAAAQHQGNDMKRKFNDDNSNMSNQRPPKR